MALDYGSFQWPSLGGTGVTIYANVAAFPVTQTTGSLGVDASTGNLYEFNGAAWVQIAGPGSAFSLGSLDSLATSVKGANLVSGVLAMQSASDTLPGIVNITTQTFKGNKTIDGNLAGTNIYSGTFPLAGGSSFIALVNGSTDPALKLYAGGSNVYSIAFGPATGLAVRNDGAGTRLLTLASASAVFADDSTGTPYLTASASVLTSTGTLSASNFSGTSSGTNTGDQTITLTGNVTGSGTGSFATTIAASAVTNSMLAGSIAYSKLSLTGAILNADLAGSIAYSKLVLTGAILNADLAGSIAYSKLVLTGAILNADLAGSIAYSKLVLTGAVVNADISASAAIAFSKLATLTSANIIVGNVSNVAAAVAVTGDISLSNAGVTAYSGTVPLNKGGTGQTTKAPAFDALQPMTTLGDIVYGEASGTGTRLAGDTSNTKKFLTSTSSAGVAAAPAWSTIAAGDVPTLNQNTSGSAASLSATLALGSGGTGQTTKAAAFDALQPMTTGGDLIYGGASGTGTRLANGSAGQLLQSAGTTLAPTWATVAVQVATVPTTQVFLSGTSATYTTPANVKWIQVRMVGGGQGGQGSGTSPGAQGAGTSTTFSTFTATNGGGGGAASGGYLNLTGGAGGTAPGGTANVDGAAGGCSVFGGNGEMAAFGNNAGRNAATNSGSGGGGASSGATAAAGNGGQAGGYLEGIIGSPAATYTYTVGTGGAGGTAGTGGSAGGTGAAGLIIVIEHYNY